MAPAEDAPKSAVYVAGMHFIGGTLGGMTGVAASYPLDTVKVSSDANLMKTMHSS